MYAMELPEVFAVVEKPLHSLAEPRQLLDDFFFQHFHRNQREQSHDRTHTERRGLAVDFDLVVIESVLLVPQTGAADGIDGISDGDEVLEEFRRHIFRGRVIAGQFQRHREHGIAEESHPGRSIGLFELAAVGQRFGAVEHADVVEPEEAAAEDVVALRVLAVDPPGEIDDELLERARQESAVALAARARHLVHAPARPGVDRRVHVVKRKLVGGKLSVRVHVPFTQKQNELFLGKMRINGRHHNHVEGEVPRREPRVFPFVGHRDDIPAVKMEPVGVPSVFATFRRRRLLRIAVQPITHDVMVELLAPEQAGMRLAHDQFPCASSLPATTALRNSSASLIRVAKMSSKLFGKTRSLDAPLPAVNRIFTTISAPAGIVRL